MKKKILAVLVTFIITIPLLTITVFGATPRWRLITSATAVCVEEDDLYYASITSINDVTQLDVHVILYEKSILSDYTVVSSIDRTFYRSYATVSSNYSFSSLKDYKVELIATAYSSSGQPETIYISEEY